jgi:hypothetical protein
MASSGHGVTITWEGGILSEILNVTPTGWSRAALNTSHSGTTGGMTFVPADLINYGEVQVEVNLNTSASPPFTQAAETCTITFPGGATYSGSAFMTGWSASVVAAPEEQIMTSTFTLKKAGTWTFSGA